jgi:hypothetical protein
LAMAFADDLGDASALTESDKALCRLAAALTVQGEAMQAAIVRQEAVDEEQLVRVTNSLTRTIAKLRTKRKPVGNASADLRSYLAAKAAVGEVAA